MNPNTASSTATVPVDYRASLKFDSYNIAPVKKTFFIPLPAPEASKDNSARFTSALAHEVRNPLTNINLSVELLKAAIKDSELNMYVDIIMRSSTRINNLVNELLKYQETDEAKVHKYSLHQLLDEVVTMAEDRIALKNIKVRKDYATRDCNIWGDMQKLRVALTNIIINAIDAMPFNNGQLTLVTKSIHGKHVIVIADNGSGISKANLKNIFTPYFTDKPGGMGLGLSTTLAILQSNNVGVGVRSEEGKGTRFILFVNKDI
jgi:signal transduction histidine kinase